MTKEEIDFAVIEARNALSDIVSQAEKFANDNICGGFFGSSRWNDACGKKISEMVVSSVSEAVADNLNLYDCECKLSKISDDIESIIAVIDSAKKEMQ